MPPPPSWNQISSPGTACDEPAAQTIWLRAPAPGEPPEIDEAVSLGSLPAARVQTV